MVCWSVCVTGTCRGIARPPDFSRGIIASSVDAGFIQIGFTFLVPAHPGSRGQRAVKPVCVCVHRNLSGNALRSLNCRLLVPATRSTSAAAAAAVLRVLWVIADVIDLYARRCPGGDGQTRAGQDSGMMMMGLPLDHGLVNVDWRGCEHNIT